MKNLTSGYVHAGTFAGSIMTKEGCDLPFEEVDRELVYGLELLLPCTFVTDTRQELEFGSLVVDLGQFEDRDANT